MTGDRDKRTPGEGTELAATEVLETEVLAATEVLDTVAATEVSAGSGGVQTGRDEYQVGDLISGRYRLDKVLGEGGMGKVFLATDELYAGEFKDREARVALKFLGAAFGEHQVSRMQLQREASRSQKLSHPNVVRVLHFDMHEGVPFMIMEYLEGQALEDMLRDARGNGKPLEEALPIIADIAAGLDYIHGEGLVHLDLKPGNVFVTSGGTAKILDLGIAQLARKPDDAGGPKTEFDASALGALTPAYASCEMFERLPPDPRDDVYALACMAYELLAGGHPFDRKPAPQARAAKAAPTRPYGLDRQRWQAIARGLAFARDERIATAGELLEALRGEKSRRRKVMLGLIGIAFIGLTAALALGMLAMQPEDPDATWRARLGALSEGAGPIGAAEQTRIENWLDQGREYVTIADEVFRGGDILTAHQILQVGADNASAAFLSVLAMTPSEEAVAGMFDIVELYRSWADETLADGNAVHSLWMSCHGLSIHNGSEALLDLADEARSELLNAANTDCAFMREQTP